MEPTPIGTELIIYFSINFLIMMIWYVIPIIINFYRKKYDLPAVMILWPLGKADIAEESSCWNWRVHVAGTFAIGMIFTLPVVILVGIYYGLHWTIKGIVYVIKPVCRTLWQGIISRIAFSKEEKVQMALGLLVEKEKEEE